MRRSSSRFHTLMSPGDEIVAARQLYGGSINQFSQGFAKFDWHVKWADAPESGHVQGARSRDKTKAIFIESIANPGGIITDIEAIAAIAHDAGVPLIVDNTLATPYLIRPFEWGADIVVHSATKFLGGHGNSMAGLIVDGGKFNWGNGKYPDAVGALPVLSRHEIVGDVRRHGLCHRLPRARPARSRAGARADERVPDPDRHRDAAAAHAAPLRQRARRREMAEARIPRSRG